MSDAAAVSDRAETTGRSPAHAAPSGAPPGSAGLRILIATPPAAAVGPIPRLTALLVEELRSKGCQVTTTTWGSGPGQDSTLSRSIGRLRDMGAVWRQTRRLSPDVVVVASAHYRNTLARDIPLLLGLRAGRHPAVLHFHGSRPELLLQRGRPLFKLASRLLVASTSAIMVLSSEEKRAWERYRPKTRAYVVRNPYLPTVSGPPDAAPAAPGAVAALRGGASEPAEPAAPERAHPPIILFVGRLLAFKGVFDLVEAGALLACAHPEIPFQIVIVGDGPQGPAVAALAEKQGIGDKVLLKGYLAPVALGATYRQATIFALPSHQEGFPTVLAEAMDAGLPIVTTAIRGAADYLEHGVNALLVPPRDPARLADTLAALLADPDLRARMSKSNREKIGIFAPATVAAEYLDILRQIAGRPAAGN